MAVLIDTASHPCTRRPADCIEIGLVNNMPDAALEATERQFIALLEGAGADTTVRLRLFTLPGLPRSERAQRHLRRAYRTLDELWDSDLDALVVTGAEPRAPALTEEPYWPALAALIDWAGHNTASTIWSCLAAHAAVHRLDGIGRRPLAEKCFGVFDGAKAADHPLTADLAGKFAVPHSRWNELREDDLAACGYTLLTRSPQAGVDAFARQGESLFVFFQGHPEYEAASLLGEYRRDLARFLRRENEVCPRLPRGYFEAETADALRRLRARAIADRREDLLAEFPFAAAAGGLRNRWRPAALAMYRNWLAAIAARKRGRRTVAPAMQPFRRSATSGDESFLPVAAAVDPRHAPALFIERRRRNDSSGYFAGARDRRVSARV